MLIHTYPFHINVVLLTVGYCFLQCLQHNHCTLLPMCSHTHIVSQSMWCFCTQLLLLRNYVCRIAMNDLVIIMIAIQGWEGNHGNSTIILINYN